MSEAAEILPDGVADISVALCVHNGARYLPDQVASICMQRPLPREIVVSDDASSDDSVAVIRKTLENRAVADRVAVISLRNDPPLGVTRNFEQALRHCRGALIALCDQDDVWYLGRLARMAAEFERRPGLLLLHSDARLVDAQLQPLGGTLLQALEIRRDEVAGIHGGQAFAVLMHRNLVTGATAMIRRSLLNAALSFSPLWVHDEWLAAVAAATGEMDLLAEPLMDYRQHGNNQIGARRMTWSGKLAKAVAPRGDKHHTRVLRMEALLAHLRELAPSLRPGVLTLAEGKLAHLRFRERLPAPRWRRAVPVLSHALRGEYGRFDRGWQAVVQDLLER